MKILCIGIAGALGAISRYAVGVGCLKLSERFPAGTLLVNLLGSFLLGLVIFSFRNLNSNSFVSEVVLLAITVGFLGGFTTFSAFSMDTVTLIQDGSPGIALWNIMLNVLLGLSAAWGGCVLADLLFKVK